MSVACDQKPINAQNYAHGGAPVPISVVLEQHRARVRLIVADKGKARSGNRQGFGLRMLNAMVRRPTGMIKDGGRRAGLRVIVSEPVDSMQNAGHSLTFVGADPTSEIE